VSETVAPTALPVKGLIDPASLMRIKSMELRARVVVEGFWNGIHRSPFHGFSVEFTEYRQYVPGDDIRFLDWKLYARTDRHYIKKFEDETNLRCHLLLDQSRSMAFGSTGYAKHRYAATLAATLATFLSNQGDAVGLFAYDDRIREALPARNRPGHLRRLMISLEREPAGTTTALDEPLRRVTETLTRRGMLVLIGDLLTEVDRMESQLGYLTAHGHEVVVFQTLDPAELNFGFDEAAHFRDLESGADLYVDPAEARETYRKSLAEHQDAVTAACRRAGVAHHLAPTDRPLEMALLEFMQDRQRRGRLVRRATGGGR